MNPTKGPSMSIYTKINHVLPNEVKDTFKKIGRDLALRNDYIVMLRNVGWSLQSIADVADTTRERIRQITVEGSEKTASFETANFPIPNPPLKPVREKRVLPVPAEEDIKRLLKLQPYAQKVRSNSPQYRQEAEEYSALIYKIYSQDGVSLFRLAKYLGVTHGALRFRMSRYGYINSKSSSKSTCYKPIIKANRYVLNS